MPPILPTARQPAAHAIIEGMTVRAACRTSSAMSYVHTERARVRLPRVAGERTRVTRAKKLHVIFDQGYPRRGLLAGQRPQWLALRCSGSTTSELTPRKNWVLPGPIELA
jgi:hypothetical protein